MNCQDAIDVMDLAMEGSLGSGVRAGFESHLAECPSCRTYFDHLHVTRRAVRLLRRASGANPRREELLKTFRREIGKPEY